MQHRILLAVLLIIIALGFNACCMACRDMTASPIPMSLAVEADEAEMWQEAAKQLKARDRRIDIDVSPRSGERGYLNAITKSEDGRWGICIAPKLAYLDGDRAAVWPLYCGALETSNPDVSLQNIVMAFQANGIEPKDDESAEAFRQRVLEASTPENPVCFSVFPSLFASSETISEILIENYLIACSRRIDGHYSEFIPDGLLSSWMLAQAALITESNSLISRAFRQIMRFRSRETSVYGLSLEAYTEFLARKQVQAEISCMRAIKASDDGGYHLLSHENAQILALLAQTAESMDGDRLEMLVRSLAPREGLPSRLADERLSVQLKTCRLASAIPDVTAGTVDACLPWLRKSIFDKDSYEMALRLIENGIYGTKADSPAITENVLSWLQNAPISDALKSLRHEFGQRFSTNERLSDEARHVLSTF